MEKPKSNIVTQISRQTKNHTRYSIYIDGEYAVSLTGDQLIASKIAVGDQIPPKRLRLLKAASTEGKLYSAAQKKLTRREHSRAEIAAFLATKGASDAEAQKICDTLRENGLLDDRRYVRAFVHDKQRIARKSQKVIRHELFKKGVSASDIDAGMDDALIDRDVLEQLVKIKLRQSRYRDVNKLLRYLAGKGFHYGDIKEVISHQTQPQDDAF